MLWTTLLSRGTLGHLVMLTVGREQPMWWWILAGVIVFVVPIVVLMRRSSGSGGSHHVPDQVYGSGPSTTPNQWGNGQNF
jgi:hypothetical protein